MSRRCPSLALLLLLLGCGQEPPQGTPAELFAGDAVLQLHLTLDEEALAALAEDPKEYVRGRLALGGRSWDDVGVRIKGNRSMQTWDGKPALKLHFGKFDEEQRFFGLEKLALNNMVEDPTMLRETLAYELHRRAGVRAPRTAYAQLFVNRRPYGLYLMVEPADEQVKGLLYEGNYGCDLYPDDVAGFEQDGGRDDDGARDELAAFAAAAAGPAAQLFGEGGPVDLPRVLAYLAVSAYVGDFDGYRHGHNYRIHHDAARGTWSFLPWGLDRTFRKRLDIHDSGGLIAKRCFADDACRAGYHRALEEVAALAETLPALLERTAALIDDAVRTDPRRPYGIKEVRKRRDQLRRYLAERSAEVRAQAAAPYAPVAPAGPCPEVVVDGVTFALCDLPMTWAEAKDFCDAQGDTLARLDSEAQSRAVGAAAKLARKKKSKWWIGVTDRPAEDEFRWSDGAPATPGFTRWAKGEPDNDSCNQDCGALSEKGNGRWHDTHCASRLPFVCRRPDR